MFYLYLIGSVISLINTFYILVIKFSIDNKYIESVVLQNDINNKSKILIIINIILGLIYIVFGFMEWIF